MGKIGGFIYALQPVGMSVVKIGCTQDPIARAGQIASFSPSPMVFRHLLDVGGMNIARTFEQDILGWSCHSAGHAEWRSDLTLIDDLFAAVAPAVDVLDQFEIPVKKTNRGSRLHSDEMECRMILAAYYDRCPSGMSEARQAIGLRHFAAVASKATAQRACDWLAANQVQPTALSSGRAA